MADGPGGKSVGRVSARVVPDTSRFPKELRAQLEKIERSIKLTLGVELDDEALQKKAKATAKKASGETVKFKAELDADGVTREAKKAKQTAQKTTGKISLLAGLNLKASLAKIVAELKIVQAAAKAYRIHIPVDWVGLSKGLLIAGALSATLLSLPHIIGAIGGAVNVVGGAFALLPAVVAGASASIAALVVGMEGIGQALQTMNDPAKFAEVLKGLAPSAQEAVKALATFREPLHEIRMAVQERLFQGMAGPLLELKKLLPPIKGGLTGIAGSIRDMGIEWLKMATRQQSIRDTGVIMGLTQSAFENARPAIANVGQALRDMAVVGSTFLPRMGLSVNRISDRFATWAANARETGRMEAWIENSWEKLKQFGRILRDIVSIFREFSEALRGGRDFGDIIEGWTQSLRGLLESAKGQETLKNLGVIMREVARVAGNVFNAAFESLADILSAATPFLLEFARSLGGAVIGALKILTPMLEGLAHWLSENKEVMAPLAVAITGVVTAFKLFSTIANLVKSIWQGLKGIWAAAKLLWSAVGLVGKGFGLLYRTAGAVATWAKVVIGHWIMVAKTAVVNAAKAAAAWVSQTAKMVATTVASVVKQAALIIAEWVKIAAAAALRAGMVLAAWIPQMATLVATSIRQAAAMAAAWVANWIRMAAVATANAIRMAAAWLIAMGPVGWIIAAVIALVALIVANWDTIKQWTIDTWNAIWKFVSDVITSIVNWAKDRFNDIVGFFKSIPGWIGDALSTLWDVISYPFRKAYDWVKDKWDGVDDFFGRIKGAIERVLKGLWEIITWPFRKAWDIIQDILGWIKDAIDTIKNAVGSAIDIVTGGFSDRIDLDLNPRAATVPVTFAYGDLRDPAIPSVGFEPYAAEDIIPETSSLGSLLSSVDRARKSLTNAMSETGSTPREEGSIAEQVAEALAGWSVVLDPRGVARLAKKGDTLNARR